MSDARHHSVPLYPALTAVYVVLALAAANGSELIQLGDLVRPLVLSLTAGLCLWGLASLIAGGAGAGAVVGALAILCFSLFGQIAEFFRVPLQAVGGATGLLVLLLYLLATGALLLRRRRGSWAAVTRYLNVVAGLLVTYAALEVVFDTSLSQNAARSFEPVRSSVPLPATSARGQFPDIYLVILDKYTGSDMLESHYGFDNRPFEDSLRARGFLVPPRAKANYIHTSLALAAMLNLDYLHGLPEQFGVNSDDWELVYPLVENHRMAALLRDRGYRYVFFPSAFAPTRRSRIADAQLPDPSFIRPEFEAVWLWSTPIPLVHAQVCRIIQCRVHTFSYTPESAELLDWKLERLPELAGSARPVFVFAHLTLPHEPYVYDRTCRHREPYWPQDDVADTLAVKEAYVAQIECLNRKLLRLVDEVSRRSRERPIILLQSDHGHGRLGRWAPGLEATEEWQVAERSAIFAAYALPGVPPAAVSESISPINVTRLVLRHYFGADLPALPDHTYWSAWGRPYRFTRLEQHPNDTP